MLRRRSLLALVIVGALLASAPSRAQVSTAAAATSPSITFAHFNDVYEIDAVENGASGGLARLATALDRLRRTSAPVVTTLGGDFLSPSALGTAVVDGEILNKSLTIEQNAQFEGVARRLDKPVEAPSDEQARGERQPSASMAEVFPISGAAE